MVERGEDTHTRFPVKWDERGGGEVRKGGAKRKEDRATEKDRGTEKDGERQVRVMRGKKERKAGLRKRAGHS